MGGEPSRPDGGNLELDRTRARKLGREVPYSARRIPLGFVLMWVVTGNLGVLPFGLLILGVPLSLLESFIAALIVKKTQ